MRHRYIAYLTVVLASIAGVSCKKNSDSDNKSFVGLEADIDRGIASGVAFQSKWHSSSHFKWHTMYIKEPLFSGSIFV